MSRQLESTINFTRFAQDLRFVELTEDPAYTAVMNPDAERWRELAAYDLGTADAMLAAGRYLYVLFCCQQAIEKHLKGLIVERCDMFPPRTHDLTKLAHVAKIAPDNDQDMFLRTLTKYYIGTRYPEEVRTLADEATRELAARLLTETKGLL
ncbi:MAG: HEPN domain-containing protein [Nitrospira sp.]|nr:HEPN domain-containing protein [Nitrospira sp.]MDH4369030.1 HEPN domain-containing protein [Nitrospira sp.]MDH5348263.1 HEPN domain-containing protein [Nitrospira sp.]MDH5496604.1 HEPN domain-containing protein [Nitrospira sp.]MDH5725035.1 HEPN domain-containing protein [Nitrospira sp.]